MTGTATTALTAFPAERAGRTPVLLSVNAGMPRNVPWQGKTVYTGVWKYPGPGPMVTFARSGISAPLPASRRNVLELADACDVPTRWSCRSGVCHTCTTPLPSGGVTCDPAPLEPPADGNVLICCAQPGTDIVLDM
jgi:ferredoxin